MGPFSFLLLLLLLLTRSPFNACLFTGSLYLLLRLFSFEPVPSRRAVQVLKPRDRVSAIAHRGGSYDAPENTLAAIRQVSPPGLAPLDPGWDLGPRPVLQRFPSLLLIAFPLPHVSTRNTFKWSSISLNSGKSPDVRYLWNTANAYVFPMCPALRIVISKTERAPAFSELALEWGRQP